jgi:hypothetical protein
MHVNTRQGPHFEAWAAEVSDPPTSTRADDSYPPSEPPAEPSQFAALMRTLGQELDRGESLVRSVVGGPAPQTVSSMELIVLQAGIYRYSETVDLTAKLVDRAGQAVRTTLQSSSG